MNVEMQYTPGCPNARPVLRRLKEIADRRAGLTLTIVRVDSANATPVGFAGSPTVLINGTNPFGGVPVDAAACALHPPTAAEVGAALESA